MPRLIKDGSLIEDEWICVEKDSDSAGVTETDAEQVLVHIKDWLSHKDALNQSGKTIGVWLDSDDDPYELINDISELPLIAVNFPVFMDGRSFSTAAIIRERLSFQGELRAIGDVIRDQVFYMKKCGINSFEVRDGADPEEILMALGDFSDSYQSTVETPEPLFRRR